MIRLCVKEVAESKGISMRRLWITSEVSLKTLQRVYNDPDYGVTTHTLNKLANALQVHPSELFEYTPDEE
jgi:DNA-binding Xre family transcriptional regulator